MTLKKLSEKQAAKRSNLVYTEDSHAGIRRVKKGSGFQYFNSRNQVIRNEVTLKRIRGLVIPPAWTEVWICSNPRGHLQATGRDSRGRKQYRYHARWRATRDEVKFGSIVAFARALPTIRRKVAADLQTSGLTREKVLATIVRLLETTLIRVGNDEYARTNGSYGLTTLHDKHVSVSQRRVRFSFRGKSGVFHEVAVEDARLSSIVRKCQQLPGQKLFQYIDEKGGRRKVNSTDVNAYLREISGQEFTAKDFRTWAGTLLMVEALRECPECESERAAKQEIVRAVDQVAERLGNTVAVCRKCYIHPGIIDAYLHQSLALRSIKTWRRVPSPRRIRLSLEEKAVLRLVKQVSS